jgi:D-xylose transport system substrate-binding protein
MHSPISRRALAIGGALCVLAFAVAACGSDDNSSSSTSGGASTAKKADKVGVLLPDTKSSVRWESFDRPLLQQAFKAANVPVTIDNAEGDKSTQQQQAEQQITNGAKVLLLVNLDSGSGAAIEANAQSRGVKVIDYDRLTLKGSAAYYVSFDNVEVGKLQGQGLVDCLGGSGTPNIAELNGSPTDNNATLFKQGYDSVLKPLYDGGKATKVADQSVPDWDNQKALTIFEQMLQKANNKIDGVLAANDGLGNSAISAIKARKLKQIPVTGQDATPQGIQNILSGDQCMTVYKAVKKEADAASKLAISLATGKPVESGLVNGKTNDTARDVPSVLLTPEAITKDNVKVVFDDGFLKPSEVCVGKYASLCQQAGITSQDGERGAGAAAPHRQPGP